MQACGSGGGACTPSPGVLWLGGVPGAGKSTVARIIARRWGLRWYRSDTYTWAHRARAARAGVPAALLFDALTPAERAARPAEEQLAMALQRERGPMTVEDLRTLPAAPLIIAEGTQILPDVVPSGGQRLLTRSSGGPCCGTPTAPRCRGYVDYAARPGAGSFATAVSTFMCECDRTDCEATVEMAVADFLQLCVEDSGPYLAPGH